MNGSSTEMKEAVTITTKCQMEREEMDQKLVFKKNYVMGTLSSIYPSEIAKGNMCMYVHTHPFLCPPLSQLFLKNVRLALCLQHCAQTKY